ncbi:hypothetical protein AWB81_07627 [Caballeronia arationis]|nr:hypothetical protein AWB81_07627 [Caballeronia arationis]
MDFAERLRLAILEFECMTFSEFSRLIGMTPANFCRILSGRYQPSFETVQAIVKNLKNTDLRWLLVGEEMRRAKRGR